MRRMLDLGQTYLSEDSKQSDPQDEQDGIPNGDEYPSGFNDEGHEVEGTRSRCQSADDDGIDLCVSQTSVSQKPFRPWVLFPATSIGHGWGPFLMTILILVM